MSRRFIAALVLAAAPAFAGGRPDLSKAGRWACYYGETMTAEDYGSLDMAVLEPDLFEPPPGAARAPIKIGYVSVGQVEKNRWYAALVSGKPFVLERDPDWPDARRIDVRSREWQDLILEKVMTPMLAKGYQGFFLDTIDTAEYLESRNPKKYAGSIKAMASFIKRVRKRFPGALILTNNGLPLLPRLGSDIDGAVVEDLYTRYEFDRKAYVKTDAAETREMESRLKDFEHRTGRPVFVIVYAKPSDDPLAKEGIRRSLSAGFRPYVATVSLDELGAVIGAGRAK